MFFFFFFRNRKKEKMMMKGRKKGTTSRRYAHHSLPSGKGKQKREKNHRQRLHRIFFSLKKKGKMNGDKPMAKRKWIDAHGNKKWKKKIQKSQSGGGGVRVAAQHTRRAQNGRAHTLHTTGAPIYREERRAGAMAFLSSHSSSSLI